MIALWKIRNDDRHGRDKETKELACHHTVLTNEFKQLYLNKDQYPVVVQNLLRPSFEAHCEDTSSQIEDWLNAYRVTFQVMHIQPDD
jgi:hemoglobin-like flavoprotein